MLSRIFGKSLPGPTPNQDSTNLQPFSQGSDAEITAVAYEPRFSLYGIGNAEGRLFVMNESKSIIASNAIMDVPICQLTSCPNSSSFVALYSQYSYEHHPTVIAGLQQTRSEQSKEYTTLISKRGRAGSVICHWIVTPERVVPRLASIKHDIISVCVSPSTPNFAIILEANGAIVGFSFEKMKFTDLYINHFEGKPAKAISCPIDMVYYIAEDKVQTVDISSLEVDNFSSIKASSIDVFNGYAAIITYDGKAQLIKGNKVVKEIKSECGGIGILSQMIGPENWIAVIRTPKGDEIYIDSKKIECQNDVWFIPSVLVKYKSFFERIEPHIIRLITLDAKICTIADGSATFSTIFPPVIQAEAVWQDGERILACERKEIGFLLHNLTKSSYVGTKEFTLPFPVSYNHGYFLCPSSDSVDCIDSLTGNVAKLMEKPAVKIIHDQKQSVIFDGEKQFVLSEEGKLIESPVNYVAAISPDVLATRVFKGEEINLKNNRTITYQTFEVEAYEDKETLMLFELINDLGMIEENGQYLLVVTDRVAFLYDIQDQMKRIRKMKLNNAIQEATILKWGGMLLRSDQTATILPLPDFTLDGLGTLTISKSPMTIIKNNGVLLQEENFLTIYSNDHSPPVLYRESTPAIEEPTKKSFFGLVEKSAPQQEEVDSSFGYKRAQSNVNQTMQTMQELLVVAQERSELLNEIEMKANKLRDSAREFRNACRKFKK
jgi:hypothetical protein